MNTPGGIEGLDNLPAAYEGLVHNKITPEEFRELFRGAEENPDEHITALIAELKNRAFASIIQPENGGGFDQLESYYEKDRPFYNKLEGLKKEHEDYLKIYLEEGQEGENISFDDICESIASETETPDDIAELEKILKKTPGKLLEFLAIFTDGLELGHNSLNIDIHDIINEDEILPTLCAKFAHYALSDEEFNLFLQAVETGHKIHQSQRYERLAREIFDSPKEETGETPIHTIIRSLFKSIRLQNSQNFVHPFKNHDIKVESKTGNQERKIESRRLLEDGFTEADIDFIEAQAAVVRGKGTREQINLVEKEYIRHPFKLDFFMHLYAQRSGNSPESRLKEARRIFQNIGLDYDAIKEEAEARKVTGVQEDYSQRSEKILDNK